MMWRRTGTRRRCFGLYYLIRDVFVTAAAFGGAVVWGIAPLANLTAAAVFGGIGTLLFLFHDGRSGRHRTEPDPRPLQTTRFSCAWLPGGFQRETIPPPPPLKCPAAREREPDLLMTNYDRRKKAPVS